MGCGVSRVDFKFKDEAPDVRRQDFKLSSCKLIFNHRQISNLNQKFEEISSSKILLDRKKNKRVAYLSVIVERLLQRLICDIGKLDSKFSSKFLVNLQPFDIYDCKIRKKKKFKYLVRLDLISTPALYPEFFEPPIRIVEGIDCESLPQGYAKIRVHGEFLEEWEEYINSSGFLRRDKIQQRFIELLARAAAKPTESFTPMDVDESKHCGSPGKIIDPITLHHILNTHPSHQFFFGSAECNELRFPDPRDFRIAIVEGVPETRLHISFLSPTAQSINAEEDFEISILLGIGVTGWPSGSDFPSRLPLDHVDVILAYQAAQLNYYLVPKGPHPSLHCEDRYSIWEIRPLATEMFLMHHYSPTSVVCRVYKILLHLLQILRARGVKIVNSYILRNLLFFELEQKKKIQEWAPKMISTRVLSILDRLLLCLRRQVVPSYLFTSKNILLAENSFEDDYISDGDILERYLKLLHCDGSNNFETNDFNELQLKDQMENVMLQKWESVITNMLPPTSNRSSRLGVVSSSSTRISYTRQQLEYVALLIREILKLKNIQKNSRINPIEKNYDRETFDETINGKDDFIYLLQIIINQAKQKLLTPVGNYSYDRSTKKKKSIRAGQVLLSYDISAALLIEDVKRSNDINFQFSDDVSIVVKIIECLYRAIDSDGRILGPVLRPYLNQIFKGSHENCWFLQEWLKKSELPEIQAMEAFGTLVFSGKIDPLEGIINAASKGWNWANSCLRIIRTITEEISNRVILGDKFDFNESGLRLLFTPEPQKTIRYNLTTLKSNKNSAPVGKYTAKIKTESDSRYATIKSFQDVLDSVISSDRAENGNVFKSKDLKTLVEKWPPHLLLRDGNPFTVASLEARRQGNHRGLGSIVQALISLQKLSVLQEISQYLPESERCRVLGDIKKLSKEIQRLSVENYKKNSFSLKQKNRFSFKKSSNAMKRKEIAKTSYLNQSKMDEPRETYKSVIELEANEEDTVGKNGTIKKKEPNQEVNITSQNYLLGTCRMLRQQYQSTLSDLNSFHTILKTESLKKSYTVDSRSAINTPFYIKMSTSECNRSKMATNF